MNCNRIAPYYRLFEQAAFGKRLQKHRLIFLEAAANKRHALILGDGDGRFSEALLHAFPLLKIDSIEISRGMIREAETRIGQNARLQIIEADALRFSFPPACYDVVFTHFFLDCFQQHELNALLPQIAASLTEDGVWIVSEFRQVDTGWRRIYSAAWLIAMYSFFRLATGLKTRALPAYGVLLAKSGFVRTQEHVSMAGLVASEFYGRVPSSKSSAPESRSA